MDWTLWSNKTIRIDYRWDSGEQLLVAYGNERPAFTLTPKYIYDNAGKLLLAQFALSYSPGYMLENWDRLLLTPLGSTAPPKISGLPPWQDIAATRKLYQDALRPIVNDLYADGSTMERLEAYLPVAGAEAGSLSIDRVRMVYLEGAVTQDGEKPDLVVVVFGLQQADIDPDQNGGGSGPPD